MDTIQQSYLLQTRGEALMGLPSAYTAPDSVDNWRHMRMRAFVRGLIEARPEARWLTVGDGRYGSDAHHLAALGARVVASSLTDERLKVAHERGFIGEYRIENAERLSCGDGEFDFVFCKEAYHHFPRPPVALYEMLRAARVGAVLIEPADESGPLDLLKVAVKRMLRGDASLLFEPSGNYIFRVRIAEMAKLMLAMGGTTMAHRRFNDFYVGRFAGQTAGRCSPGMLATRTGIAAQDLLCRLRLMGWGLCAVVLFRAEPGAAIRAALQRSGFTLTDLPRNPYL